MASFGLIVASVLIFAGLTLALLPSRFIAYPLHFFRRPGPYAQISPAQMEHAINRLERYIAIKEGERAGILAKQTQQVQRQQQQQQQQQTQTRAAPNIPVVRAVGELRQKEEKTKGYLKQLDDLQREIEGMIAERQRQSEFRLCLALGRIFRAFPDTLLIPESALAAAGHAQSLHTDPLHIPSPGQFRYV